MAPYFGTLVQVESLVFGLSPAKGCERVEQDSTSFFAFRGVGETERWNCCSLSCCPFRDFTVTFLKYPFAPLKPEWFLTSFSHQRWGPAGCSSTAAKFASVTPG